MPRISYSAARRSSPPFVCRCFDWRQVLADLGSALEDDPILEPREQVSSIAVNGLPACADRDRGSPRTPPALEHREGAKEGYYRPRESGSRLDWVLAYFYGVCWMGEFFFFKMWVFILVECLGELHQRMVSARVSLLSWVC